MTPRLTPIPYDDWDFESLAEISPGMKPPPLNVVAFFAHHPGLTAEGFDPTSAPSQKGT